MGFPLQELITNFHSRMNTPARLPHPLRPFAIIQLHCCVRYSRFLQFCWVLRNKRLLRLMASVCETAGKWGLGSVDDGVEGETPRFYYNWWTFIHQIVGALYKVHPQLISDRPGHLRFISHKIRSGIFNLLRAYVINCVFVVFERSLNASYLNLHASRPHLTQSETQSWCSSLSRDILRRRLWLQ